MKRKKKRKKRDKREKKKFIWGGLLVLFVLGICTALLAFLCSRTEKEVPESQPKGHARTPLPEIPTSNNRREKKMKKWMKCTVGGLYFLLILGVCIAPLLLLWVRPVEETTENRTMASLPQIWTQAGFNWNFLPEAGAYFTDHFAFRQEMVSINSGIRSRIFGTSSVEDVIVGQNGWLYYAATLDDYQHKNSVSERMLFNIAHNTALMQEYSEGLGKTFVFTIAPNKNSLYDENMPARLRFQVAKESDAQRLLPWLIRENVNYVDLFELFGEQEETLYYARDSHWNDKGAVMVYNALLDACEKQHETYEGTEPVQETDYFGDLGVMLFPMGAEPESRFQYPLDATWHYVEGEQVEDQFIRTENDMGEGNLLMYRDSFGNSLHPYMAQTFSQTVFSKQIPYPMNDLVTYEADILIVEKVERQLPTLGKVPPLMSAPVRETEKLCISVGNTAATVQVSKEGIYWKLEGTADEAYMDTESHIYVEVDDGSGAKLYEVFCISSTDALSGSTNDYGYLLYLPEVLVSSDLINIRVMTEQEEAMVVMLQEQLPVLQPQESVVETKPEQEGTAGVEQNQESTAETEPEQESAAGVEQNQESAAETEQKQEGTVETEQGQESTAGTAQKQEGAAETKPEQEGNAGTVQKQESTAETKQKQESTAQTRQKKETQKEAEAKVQTEDTISGESSQKNNQAQAEQNPVQKQAEAQIEAEVQAESEKQAQIQDQGQPAPAEVSRTYMEDCGTDSGYWVITYSDGHVEYLDD